MPRKPLVIHSSLKVLLSVAVMGLVQEQCLCFSLLSSKPGIVRTQTNIPRRKNILFLGLYDTPLPSRPGNDNGNNKNQGEDNNNDNDEDEEYYDVPKQVLFKWNKDGKEVQGLLPSLSRRFDTGIGCYYEIDDRTVRHLSQKTNCLPEDAAWALEACKGDITEAWTRILTARRALLEKKQGREKDVDQFDDRWEKELYKLVQNENTKDLYEQRKNKILQEDKQRQRKDLFNGGKVNENWLPTNSPKPIDDEPWFTG